MRAGVMGNCLGAVLMSCVGQNDALARGLHALERAAATPPGFSRQTSALPLHSQALGLLRDAGVSFGSLFNSQLGAIGATAPSGEGQLDSIR